MITVSNVVNATKTELVCITYQLFINRIDEAQELQDKNDRKKKIKETRDVLLVLTESLDLNVDLAKNLFRIYVYIQNILINHWEDNEKLSEAKMLIQTIQEGYQQISEPNEEKAMNNAQSIYAGMTYGRGYLNEMTIDSVNRGYQA